MCSSFFVLFPAFLKKSFPCDKSVIVSIYFSVKFKLKET